MSLDQCQRSAVLSHLHRGIVLGSSAAQGSAKPLAGIQYPFSMLWDHFLSEENVG